MSAWKEGQRIKLAEHKATRGYGVGGIGTVTAVKLTDPVNKKVTVIIRTGACFLHVQSDQNGR